MESKEEWEKDFEDFFTRTKRSEEFKARYKEVWKECADLHAKKLTNIVLHLKSIIDILKTTKIK